MIPDVKNMLELLCLRYLRNENDQVFVSHNTRDVRRNGSFRICLVVIGLVFSRQAYPSQPDAVLINLDADGNVTVSSLLDDRVTLKPGYEGIVLWGEGGWDRWQHFKESWQRPSDSRSSSAEGSGLRASIRGVRSHLSVTREIAQSTSLIPQLRSPAVTRGVGSLSTPYDNALLISPLVTFRRELPNNGEMLPEVVGVLYHANKEILRIRFPESVGKVRWADIPDMPAQWQQGLPSGDYVFEMPTVTGPERIGFVVAEASAKGEVTDGADALLALDPEEPALSAQVSVEECLAYKPTLLCDALDIIEELPEVCVTDHLTALKAHIIKRLEDPEQAVSVPDCPSEPTGDPLIDNIRGLVAASRWQEALEQLNSIPLGNDAEGKRREALAQLYRGVILGESGSGNEQEAVSAFRLALTMLERMPSNSLDLQRAHNDFGNYLLGRAADRVDNHAFQIAAGVNQPFVTCMKEWIAAKREYDLALAFSTTDEQRASVELNMARQFVLLGDIVRTLSSTNEPEPRLDVVALAADVQAESILTRVIKCAGAKPCDMFVEAVAEELLAQIAFRRNDLESSRTHIQRSRSLYLAVGSLTGMESSGRLLGLCLNSAGPHCSPKEALRSFLVSQQLSEILRARIPVDQIGLSRAGFFARRVYVTEQIVELLIGEGRVSEALSHVEHSRSRSFQDALNANSVEIQDTQPNVQFLENWPEGTVAIEYFLGTEKAWCFLVEPPGRVTVFPLVDVSGKAVSSADLLQRIQRFISDVDHLLVREGERVLSGRYDNRWQDDLHELYRILIPDAAADALSKVNTVVIVPHNLLHYLPFSALVVETDSKCLPSEMPRPHFLIEGNASLLQAPSLTTWSRSQRQSASQIEEVRALGDAGTSGLPGVTQDLQNLSHSFGEKVKAIHTGRSATEANAKAMLGDRGLAFFGSHGQEQPDQPINGRLIFDTHGTDGEDGFLTAAEVYALPVSSDMVIMSACYSGRADRSPMPGDDLFGLQRALLQSGAKSVVAGLWDVYDGKAPELMNGVFVRLSKGEAIASAMANSQRAFIKKYRDLPEPRRYFTHPYFWAVYGVWGDGRTLLRN